MIAILLGLQCILKPCQPFNRLSSFIDPLVRPLELPDQRPNNQDNQGICYHCRQQPWSVIGGILGPEDRRPDDSSNATPANQCSGCECAFPLPTDIITIEVLVKLR